MRGEFEGYLMSSRFIVNLVHLTLICRLPNLHTFFHRLQVRMHTVIQQYNPAVHHGPKAAAAVESGSLLMLEGGGVGGSPGARARNRRDMTLDAVVARARSRCGI